MDNVQKRFTAYLVRAVKNTVIDYMEKKKRGRKHILLVDAMLAEAIETTSAERDWPEKICFETKMAGIRRKETGNEDNMDCKIELIAVDWNDFLQSEYLKHLVKRLTGRERNIVFQRIVLEQSFSEIGKAYELSESQAKHVYYYAIHKLRRYADGI